MRLTCPVGHFLLTGDIDINDPYAHHISTHTHEKVWKLGLRFIMAISVFITDNA